MKSRRLKRKRMSNINNNMDNLGIFKDLPPEILMLILSYLSVADIARCCMVSRMFKYYGSSDYLRWIKLSQLVDINNIPKPINIGKVYNDFIANWDYWHWDLEINKRLEVSDNRLIVTRPSIRGTNPAMRTSNPFTRRNNWYQVQVITRGTWIGVGLVDDNFIINGDATMGRQKNGINAAFFCQDSSLLQMHNQTDIAVNRKIRNGDRIKVVVDFDSNSISFYSNDEMIGQFIPNLSLTNVQLYPCVQLSYATSITLITPNLY